MDLGNCKLTVSVFGIQLGSRGVSQRGKWKGKWGSFLIAFVAGLRSLGSDLSEGCEWLLMGFKQRSNRIRFMF